LLLLTSTSDKIQVITSGTAGVDVHASYIDLSAGTVTAGRENSKITTATTTDVVDPPAASTTRNVKALHVANIHATDPNTVTIQHTDGTNVVQLESVTLLAGERISYREGVGMRVITSQGIEKTLANINPPILTKKALADHPNSTTTATEVTDLSLACGVGTWWFEYALIFQSATSTVGPKLSVNYDGTVTTFLYEIYSVQVNTADSLGALDQDATALQVVGAFAARAKGATGALIGTVGVDTINLDILLSVRGIAVVTVAGNFELWHGSETATSTTIKKDSSLRLTQIGS
jgi:hypothetical protein